MQLPSPRDLHVSPQRFWFCYKACQVSKNCLQNHNQPGNTIPKLSVRLLNYGNHSRLHYHLPNYFCIQRSIILDQSSLLFSTFFLPLNEANPRWFGKKKSHFHLHHLSQPWKSELRLYSNKSSMGQLFCSIAWYSHGKPETSLQTQETSQGSPASAALFSVRAGLWRRGPAFLFDYCQTRESRQA